ncbi:3-deoxy-manno-octulosonate cytidylyltransferase [soil metagenome]
MIIPARFGSSRFPAKILAAETGRPLVQHVVDQVGQCKQVERVIVATDDQRIADALKPFGTRCEMTSPDHQSGTDRIAEVARGLDDDIIVNVQGDEPEIEPATIDSLIELLQSTDATIATAATRWPEGADPHDPNLVKVVVSQAGHALYFSRAPIPYPRDEKSTSQYLVHQGIYAYRRDFLLEFAAMPQTDLEKTEKLEQLRALENGHKISVLITDRAVHGIDTVEQYKAFVERTNTKRNHEVTKPRSGS